MIALENDPENLFLKKTKQGSLFVISSILIELISKGQLFRYKKIALFFRYRSLQRGRFISGVAKNLSPVLVLPHEILD